MQAILIHMYVSQFCRNVLIYWNESPFATQFALCCHSIYFVNRFKIWFNCVINNTKSPLSSVSATENEHKKRGRSLSPVDQATNVNVKKSRESNGQAATVADSAEVSMVVEESGATDEITPLCDLVVGVRESAELSGKPIPDKTRSIYVTRFNPTATVENIMHHVKSIAVLGPVIDKILCTRLVSGNRKNGKLSFVSFKMDVPEECFDTLMSSDSWPSGVTAKEFEHRSPRKMHPVRKRSQVRFTSDSQMLPNSKNIIRVQRTQTIQPSRKYHSFSRTPSRSRLVRHQPHPQTPLETLHRSRRIIQQSHHQAPFRTPPRHRSQHINQHSHLLTPLVTPHRPIKNQRSRRIIRHNPFAVKRTYSYDQPITKMRN